MAALFPHCLPFPLGTAHPFILVVSLFWHQREFVWITKWCNLAGNLIRNGSAVWRCITTANTDEEQRARASKMTGAFGVSAYISASNPLCGSCNWLIESKIVYKLGWSPDPTGYDSCIPYLPAMQVVRVTSIMPNCINMFFLRHIPFSYFVTPFLPPVNKKAQTLDFNKCLWFDGRSKGHPTIVNCQERRSATRLAETVSGLLWREFSRAWEKMSPRWCHAGRG